jgi:carbamoyltransferase
VRFTRHPDDRIPSLSESRSGGAQALTLSPADAKSKLAKVRGSWPDFDPLDARLAIHATPPERLLAEFAPEQLALPKHALAKHSLREIRDLPLRRELVDRDNRYWLHFPATVQLSGRDIPAAYVDHHAAHAASSYYQSGLQGAMVLTFDGGDRHDRSSGAYLAFDNVIVPLVMPGMWIGTFYDAVAARVYAGCDAGKLMGLAPYGRPAFFLDEFIGGSRELGHDYGQPIANAWLTRALATAAREGYDLSALGNRAMALAPINADLAASAHKTFEENVLATIDAIKPLADRAAALVGGTIEGLCMSGGCALSCPTNTRAALTGLFPRVFVAPSCDDSGLSLGGALWSYHNLLDRPLIKRNAAYPLTPYLGVSYGAETVQSALAAQGSAVHFESPRSAGAAAAHDLAAGKIIGWYEGRSELGPRALGHRSILCDPRSKENWPRVNLIKSREVWRPFAPAVLEEDAAGWFKDMPLPSPYMLFTGDVIAPEALAAITHVDGSARVQTVTAECGIFYDVLREFRSLTQCPVVMNTSLNGPGEPIVETPIQALQFFLKSELDVLYLDGYRVTKASSTSSP